MKEYGVTTEDLAEGTTNCLKWSHALLADQEFEMWDSNFSIRTERARQQGYQLEYL
jgi:hypothetical protein